MKLKQIIEGNTFPEELYHITSHLASESYINLSMLIEEKQEDVAMKMLSAANQLDAWGKYFKGITAPYSQKGPGKNHKHLPFLVNWFLSDKVSPNVIKQYYDRFMKNPKLHNIPLEKFNNFHEFEQRVDSTVEMDSSVKDIDLSEVKPHYEDEHVKVYLGDSRPKCIHYGQGRKYGFCISRDDSSNLYNSYRGRGATFYFVYFKNKRYNPPSNLIVLHNYGSKLIINKTTPNSDTITTKEQVLSEFPILENAFDKLSHKPHTDDEKRSMKISGKKITDLKNINDKILWLEYNANKPIKNEEWKQIPEQQWEPLLKKSLELGHIVSFDVLEKFKKHIPRFILIQKRYQEEGTIKGLDKTLVKAVNENRILWVKLLIISGATELNSALNVALYNVSRDNNLEIIKYLVEKGATDLDGALDYASDNNNLEMVKYLVEKGATYLDGALRNASGNNNLEIIKYLVEKGATDLDGALYNASYNNNLEMVKYLVEKGATYLDGALEYASRNNHFEVVKYLVEKRATYLNDALVYASDNNHLELVKYLVEKGATDLDSALRNASGNNHFEVVKYLVEKRATYLNDALVYASDNNHLEMVKYLVEKGATDLDGALDYASDNNNLEMVKYLKRKIEERN